MLAGIIVVVYWKNTFRNEFVIVGEIKNLTDLECPAAFVPASMRQTGMRGAVYGARKEA
jgi:hypothetical protein